MNLLADESLEREIVERLRADGHDVVYVAELSPGISDEVVLGEANARSAPLVTADKDFGELVYRLGRHHAGVILVRLAGLTPQTKAEAVSEVFRTQGERLVGGFCVVSPGSVRMRHPPPESNGVA